MSLILTARKNPHNPRYYFVQVSKRRADDRGNPVQDLVLELRLHDYEVTKRPAGQVVITPVARQAVLALAAELFANPELPIRLENPDDPQIQAPPR